MLRPLTRFRSCLAVVAVGTMFSVAAAADPAGVIAGLVGNARAVSADGSTRSLACGDSLAAGETVKTGKGSQVGILSNDVYAQLAGATAARVGRTDRGAFSLDLAQGSARLLDSDDSGAPSQLRAGTVLAQVDGNDTEAHRISEKAGLYAMVCEWDQPLSVARGQEALGIEPGDCVVAKARERLYRAPAHTQRIGLAGLDRCQLDPGAFALANLSDHFNPADVAALAAAVPAFPGPQEISSLPRDACDDPGSGCAGSPVVVARVPPPPVAPPMMPPPDPDMCPGGLD